MRLEIVTVKMIPIDFQCLRLKNFSIFFYYDFMINLKAIRVWRYDITLQMRIFLVPVAIMKILDISLYTLTVYASVFFLHSKQAGALM